MESEQMKNRQFDINSGRREYTLGIRMNKKERLYIEKKSKSMGINKSMFIIKCVLEYKKNNG